MSVKTWEIVGYLGNSDYDGPEDDNFRTVVDMDSRFTKQDVLDIFIHRFSKRYFSDSKGYRTVCLRVNQVENSISNGKIRELIDNVLTCDTCFNGESIEVNINWDEIIDNLIQHGVITSSGV